MRNIEHIQVYLHICICTYMIFLFLFFFSSERNIFIRFRMETFQEAGVQMLKEFRALLQHSPLPLPGTRLLQLLALNMFAIETTQLKGESQEKKRYFLLFRYNYSCRNLYDKSNYLPEIRDIKQTDLYFKFIRRFIMCLI